jgi:oligopeptide transport system substrate-binding protein
MYAQVTLGTKEGLVQLAPDGRSLVPAQAERWEVSEDGMTYTFYLRKDNVWYDGTPVTAWDYEAAFIYQTEPGRQSKFTWDTPLPYVERVMDFRNGAARAEEVGIDVLDDYTIRFRMGLPYPAFMNAMITGSMFPIHRGSLEKYGEDWHKPEHYQGNGPYRIVEWELNSHVIVEPNPLYNLPRGNLERAISWFAGRPLEAYQSEEVDFSIIGGSIADVYFARRHPVLRNELVLVPTSGLCFVGFMFSENPVFWDARVRRAVAMAFDEAAIVEAIYQGTQVPMRMMSTPAMPDWEEDFGIRYDPEAARRLLAEAGYPGGEGFPRATLLVPSSQIPQVISEFVAIAKMIRDNLGIDFRIDNQEWGVYADKGYNLLNDEDYFGLTYLAAGAPWPNPVYGGQWAQNVIWTDSLEVYKPWVDMQQEIFRIMSGMVEVDGGETVGDFERLSRKIGTYRDSVLALYADGRHGPHLREEAEYAFQGWMQTADEILEEARAPNAKLDRLWKEINATLVRVQQSHYESKHWSELRWRLEEMRQDALRERDLERQSAINREMHRLVLEHGRYIPLRVTISAALVKPYVKGLTFCPYWWGNPLYLKRVSIEDRETTEHAAAD